MFVGLNVPFFLRLSMKHVYLLTPKITLYVKDTGDKGCFNMLITKDNFDSVQVIFLQVSF